MSQRMRMEEIYIETNLIDPATSYEWVWKVVIDHGVVINAKYLVDFDLRLVDLLLCPGLSAEHPEPELSVIRVHHCILHIVGVLLDLLDLDILVLTSSDLFLNRKLLCLH